MSSWIKWGTGKFHHSESHNCSKTEQSIKFITLSILLLSLSVLLTSVLGVWRRNTICEMTVWASSMRAFNVCAFICIHSTSFQGIQLIRPYQALWSLGQERQFQSLIQTPGQVNTLPESTTHYPSFTDCERSPDQLHWFNASCWTGGSSDLCLLLYRLPDLQLPEGNITLCKKTTKSIFAYM